MPGDGRLLRLLAAHLVLGLLSALFATVEIHTPIGLPLLLIVPLFALTFCQVSLLGLWSVFSSSALWKRLSGWVIGTAYLEAAFDLDFGSEFLFMPSAAMALTVASLLVVRWSGVRLIRRADRVDTRPPESRGFRFSIRGLMILTAVVALLSAAARSVPTSHGHPSFVPTVMLASCFVTVALLALGAALGTGHPIRRGIPPVAVSPVLGTFFGLAVNAHRDGWVYLITIMLLYPAVLLGSLLIVRSCGYRLVSRRASFKRGGSEPVSEDRSGDGSVTTVDETGGCRTRTG